MTHTFEDESKLSSGILPCRGFASANGNEAACERALFIFIARYVSEGQAFLIRLQYDIFLYILPDLSGVVNS